MDEFNNEGVDYVEEEEEILDIVEMEAEIEESEQQRAEAADLAKLFRQHPEIWIPYEEHVMEQLNTKLPGPIDSTVEDASVLMTGLRDTSILDSAHKTYPFLTSYERTKCISFRASQICNGAKPYILVPEGVTDAYEIAKLELESKRLPFIVKRPMPDGSFEAWRLTDLVVF